MRIENKPIALRDLKNVISMACEEVKNPTEGNSTEMRKK
jgi:hypothetical protein